MKRIFTLFAAMLIVSFTFGQNVVKGKLIDGDTNEALIGASVMVDGTSLGTVSDYNGDFMIANVKSGTQNLIVSYVGYETKSIAVEVNGTTDLGNVTMGTGGVGMDLITVTGVMDIVKDRRTPVAVSTITAADIQAKTIGNVEIVEVAKATPSVFVANQAGGYGDSEVWTRGFDQPNTAFLLNGQPINGMEDGKMYWSNWSGLTDVASAVQIQRGLGASKLAISSVGGTWNFVMKATQMEKGGSIFSTIGNDAYKKAGVSYSTGLINDKFAITVLASAWSGDGWANGAKGEGQTYFLSAGYKPNKNHTINFLITGAPQWHDQKFQTSIYSHENAEGDIDRRYNNNWGVYDGQYFTERRNYYHKPVINLNWDWDINDKSSFAMVLYGSFGRGGGTGNIGGSKIRTESGLINFDATAADTTTNYIRRASVNNHNWFGSVLKYDRKINDNISFSVGGDLRRYFGDHFRQVNELFGRDNYTQSFATRYPDGIVANTEFKADPWAALSNFAEKDERIAYNNGETINYGGVFGQVEYGTDNFSAYLQGAVSSQNHVRHEYYWAAEADEDSEKVTNTGYNLKLGASYEIGDNHMVFANAGQYSRQPFHDVIFEGNSNVLTPDLENEKITGLEAGYKFQSGDIYANINAYYTKWENRILQNFINGDAGETVILSDDSDYVSIEDDPYENILQDQIHSGVELDLGMNISDDLTLKAFGSIGQWDVDGERAITLFDGEPRAAVKDYTTTGDNIKVGGAPQTSFGAGLRYNIMGNFSTELQYFYYDKLYAANGGIELPSYSVFDINLQYSVHLQNGQVLRFNANIYNLFDAFYISKSRTSIEADENEANNWEGINKANQVTFGKGRTYNFTMKYSF